MVGKVSEIKNIGHRAFCWGRKEVFKSLPCFTSSACPCKTSQDQQSKKRLHTTRSLEKELGCANTALRLAVLQVPQAHTRAENSSTNSLC